MPFSLDNFSRTGTLGGGSIWAYSTTDTLTTVLTSGYFDDASLSLKAEDVILFQTSDNSGSLTVKTLNPLVVRLSPNSALQNFKRVSSADDLGENPDPTLAYFIDGVVDFTGVEINVPLGGLLINGYGFDKSKMICTDDNYTMFKSPAGDSGDIFINNCSIEVSGASSKVFALKDATGLKACEFDRVNWDNCTDRGYFDGYRQGLETGTGCFGGTPSLEFRGAWLGGYRTSTTIVRFIGAGTTLYKSAVGQTFASRFASDINADIPAGSTCFEFAEANFLADELLQIDGANLQGAGTYLTGIASTSRKVRISNTKGLLNTYVGGYWVVTSESATSASSTLAKLAGVTDFNGSWFDEPSDNAMTVATSQPIVVTATFTGSFTGANNRQYKAYIRHWDNSASSYINKSSTTFTTGSAGRAENVGLITTFFEVNEDDRVEVWIEDLGGTSNITMLNDSQFRVNEVKS